MVNGLVAYLICLFPVYASRVQLGDWGVEGRRRVSLSLVNDRFGGYPCSKDLVWVLLGVVGEGGVYRVGARPVSAGFRERSQPPLPLSHPMSSSVRRFPAWSEHNPMGKMYYSLHQTWLEVASLLYSTRTLFSFQAFLTFSQEDDREMAASARLSTYTPSFPCARLSSG